MNHELFKSISTTPPRTDTDQDQEPLELTLDELSYVAGGLNIKKTDFDA